ncbi:MAG: hypothetical protein WAV68_00455 [Candidatus Nanogingivalis sp.]
MKMNEFVTRTSIEEIRSGTFSSAQGGRFGAASSVSFEKRRSIDRQNSKIRAYRDSKLVQSRAARQGEISASANSSLQAIRERRLARENSSNESSGRNRQTSSVSGSQIERSTSIRMKQKTAVKRDFSSVSQSGMTGFHSAGGVSSGQVSGGFHQIQPKIGR